MKEEKYLTDDELAELICEIETQDMVSAPPDLLNHILEKLPEKDTEHSTPVEQNSSSEQKLKPFKPPKQRKQTSPRRDFQAYCLQVIVTTAAAIAFLFLAPNLLALEHEQTVPREQYEAASQIKSKEEVLSQGLLKKMRDSNKINETLGKSKNLVGGSSNEIKKKK